ncbi:AIM24 family protein [Allonocardiopsis opalescens]|uniref:Uncharacterized protein (AIM24 family) n=1 Tax=Allonocardiopsis opalescens TaxID=1144618 RepID=A0A2T0Q310_9ACTN|nr:AIM24 family protein [Allonocardiopsis opalescens]PRX98182.1 uncharacterized protein (AIM24 family) [Allonocardiopsis opalescens]
MRGDIFSKEHQVAPPTQAGMSLQNSRCVRYVVNGEVLARQGAMVAFRGNLQFEVKSQGIGNFLKRAATGEGLSLMAVRGQGEVWLADTGAHCFILDVEDGDRITVNGKNVLCFEPTLRYDIQVVKGAGMFGGGLFNTVFDGHGRLAITCDGDPIVLPVSSQLPVFVDTDAVVCWSSGLQTSINRSQSVKSMLKGGSGEAAQLRLDGDGFVVVQPSEGVPVQPQQGGGGGGGG